MTSQVTTPGSNVITTISKIMMKFIIIMIMLKKPGAAVSSVIFSMQVRSGSFTQNGSLKIFYDFLQQEIESPLPRLWNL